MKSKKYLFLVILFIYFSKKSVTHHSVIIQSPKPLTIEEKLKEKEKETKELKKILDQLNKEKNDLEITKKKLEAEILQLKTKLEQRDELKHPTKNNKKFDSKLEEVTRTFTDELDKVKRQLEVKQAEVEVLHEENQKLQEKLEKLDGVFFFKFKFFCKIIRVILWVILLLLITKLRNQYLNHLLWHLLHHLYLIPHTKDYQVIISINFLL